MLRQIPAVACLLCAAGLLVTGCARYQAKPIDLHEYSARWSAVLDDLATADTGFNPDKGLSLEDAKHVALFGNADLRHARLAAGVSLASAEHAGQWSDPLFELGVLNNTDTGSDPWILGAALGFTIPLSGSLGVERDVANAKANQARLEAINAEWQMLEELEAAWFEWSSAKAKSEVLKDYLAQSDQLIDTAEKLVDAGEASPAQARLLRIEHHRRQIQLTELLAEARQRELTLFSLMGLRPQVDVTLLPATFDLPEFDMPQDAAALVEQHYPPLRVRLAAYDAAEHALNREIRKQYPDLTIGPAYQNEEDQSRVGVGLSLPIPLWNRNRRAIATAHANRELARADVKRTYQQAMALLAQAKLRLRAAAAKRSAIRQDLAPLVDTQIKEIRGLIAIGELEALFLKDALETLVDTRLAHIDAQAEEAAAVAELHHLLGLHSHTTKLNHDSPEAHP